MLMRSMPVTSVRGAIRTWIAERAHRLGDNVLEVGSRQHVPNAWWLVNRDLAEPGADWTGIDMQAGPGVDVVADVHELPIAWREYFSGVLCSEVLEHVARPWRALPELRRVIRPGGWALFTTMTCFPVHGFPDDFYRFTESGLRVLLEDAGFLEVKTFSAGLVPFTLNDHGERGYVRRTSPMHVFAEARC